ncbi:MAG: tyrosine-protein phosphatase [Parvibaculales bacterium]
MTPAETRLIAAELPHDQRHANRRIAFDGAHNFRDLGGYANPYGQKVKWGRLYRSDRLSNLSTEDLKLLKRLGLHSIVDLRSKGEREAAPSRLPDSHAIDTHIVPVFEDGAFVDALWRAVASGELLGRDLHDIMVEANRNFITRHCAAFQNFMRIVSQPAQTPLMFHCMAGKDRTGFGAALILSILGISREVILADYLETNIHLAANAEEKYQDLQSRIGTQASYEDLRPILGVHEDYLNAAFETLEKEYGSLEDYLSKALGVTDQMLDTMRDNYLEQV